MCRFLEWLIAGVLARAFPGRWRIIPRAQDGAPLLRQFKFCRWVYLQSFVNPELPEFFHFHRFRFMFSIVLSGWFIEERYPGKRFNFFKNHFAPSVYTMDRSTVHRLHAVDSRTWTLFFQFGNTGDWGYLPRAETKIIPWDQFIPDERKVKAL